MIDTHKKIAYNRCPDITESIVQYVNECHITCEHKYEFSRWTTYQNYVYTHTNTHQK